MLVSHGVGSMTTFPFVKTKNVSDAISISFFTHFDVGWYLYKAKITLFENEQPISSTHERRYCWRTPTIHERDIVGEH